MSEFLEFKTEFRNKETLLKALGDVGYGPGKVEVHETPQRLRGYENDLRSDTAHIIIRKRFIGNLSNDIGFIKREDGKYEAIISAYDKGRHGQRWLDSIAQNYSAHAIRQKAKRKGYRVTEKRVGGRIQMTLRKG